MTLLLKGVILVGGASVGTRFRPLSMDIPKPLFPIAGRPLLHHHVSALSKVLGLKEILLVGFYEASVFDRFLSELQEEFPSLSIKYLREYQALGTAGGLYHFRDEIMRGGTDAFFVLNGDIVSSFPLNELLSVHRESKAIGTVLSSHVDKEKANKYGSLVAAPETGEVMHFVEKPETFISDTVSCGIYVFTGNIFPVLSEAISLKRNQEIEDGTTPLGSPPRLEPELIQLEKDILPLLVQKRGLFTFTMDSLRDFWLQVKTGSSTLPANRATLQYFMQAIPRRLTKSTSVLASPDVTTPSLPSERTKPELIQPVYIHPSAMVHPSAKIGPNVSIGPRVVVSRGVRIRDAIILDNSEVRHDACVLNSVIGADSKIGAWARLEGAPISEAEGSSEEGTAKGFKIPSAVILGKGVTVSDEIIIRNCIVLPHKELK